jgi:hypothetical protein
MLTWFQPPEVSLPQPAPTSKLAKANQAEDPMISRHALAAL